MKKHFIFVNELLKPIFSSIETAIFQRFEIFTQFLGITPTYLCVRYDLSLPVTLKKLKKQKKIPENLHFVNLYEFFLSDCENYLIPQPDFTAENTVIIARKGKKEIVKHYHPETKFLLQVQYFTDTGTMYRCDGYDAFGYLSHTTTFYPDGKLLAISFYRRNGSLAASFQYNTSGKKHIVVFDKAGTPVESLTSEDGFHLYLLRYYLNKTFSHQEQVNLIFDRELSLGKYLPNGKVKAQTNSALLFHSNHITEENGEMRMRMSSFDQLNEHYRVITLTQQQTDDICQNFAKSDYVHCIPHPVEQHPQTPYTNRKKHRVIGVGRLSEEKQHNKMIRIFAKVVKAIPDAQLDIFGVGDLKAELQKQINELSLQNNVHLKGFSHNVAEEYKTAQCSLLTSKLEGQPLVILESLSYGCPVISSDIKYGPAEMIEDGKNGFLLPKDDETQFAERIIQVLQNPALAEQLSHNATQSVQRFAMENIAPLWQQFVEKLTK